MTDYVIGYVDEKGNLADPPKYFGGWSSVNGHPGPPIEVGSIAEARGFPEIENATNVIGGDSRLKQCRVFRRDS